MVFGAVRFRIEPLVAVAFLLRERFAMNQSYSYWSSLDGSPYNKKNVDFLLTVYGEFTEPN